MPVSFAFSLFQSLSFERKNGSILLLKSGHTPNSPVTNRLSLSPNRTIASRKNLTCNLGYVFTKRPLNLNEKLVIQILRNDQLYNGNLGFGLTTCNPAQLSAADLPADSHKLLDRNEYWVVIKDVLVNAKCGDELGFTINSLNQVQLTKNSLPPVTLMHVDATQRFYAFFDLHGKTTKIQVLGTYYEPMTVAAGNPVQSFANSLSHSNNLSNHYSENNSRNGTQVKLEQFKRNGTSSPKPLNQPANQSPNQSPNHSPNHSLNQLANQPTNQPTKQAANQSTKTAKSLAVGQESSNGECTVCFEKMINCVLYQCGHMCMCYTCALRQWQGVGGNGQCPICRAYICDVIRTYYA